ACAAALATLEVITEEGLVDNAARMGSRLVDGARAVANKHPEIGDVRGIGLMVASEFVTPEEQPDTVTATKVHSAAAEAGLLLLTCGPFGNVVRMIPPLVVDAEQIDEALQLWADAVELASPGERLPAR
ncbi:MAG: aminotransferase class III-fold pyridoxal phosphate-dependent enzyme, partial [Sciscionella sp.]